MGSKLEYWFLLTKIAVVVLDVMIEDGISVVVPALGRLVVNLLWHVGGGMFFYLPSQTRQFSKVQFPIGFGFWIFQFSKSPSQLPKIRPITNLLVNYYGGNWKIQKSPNCPKFSQFTQKSQFPIPLPKSNFRSPKIIQPERYCAGLANYNYLDNKMA
jgi:hypothetical protein